jgi:hypothetical protein
LRTVTPSSRPSSSAILPSTTLITVVPVNSILLPEPSGRAPTGEIVERGAGVGPATLPLPDDVAALGDEVGGCPEAEIGERPAKPQRELSHLVAPPKRLVQRVLEPDVWRGQLVDDARVEVAAPESVNHRTTTALLSSTGMSLTLLVRDRDQLRRLSGPVAASRHETPRSGRP